MTGSLIGRGFSDEICARGWLLLELTTDGRVTVTPQYVWRRPQIDFDTIDARGKTIEQINTIIRERLAESDWWDDESAEISGDGGYILRQKISYTTGGQRHGLRALAGSGRQPPAAPPTGRSRGNTRYPVTVVYAWQPNQKPELAATTGAEQLI
ncbi:hypothetical protein GCM10020255_020610 [Rhodococcus baikonurensis]